MGHRDSNKLTKSHLLHVEGEGITLIYIEFCPVGGQQRKKFIRERNVFAGDFSFGIENVLKIRKQCHSECSPHHNGRDIARVQICNCVKELTKPPCPYVK